MSTRFSRLLLASGLTLAAAAPAALADTRPATVEQVTTVAKAEAPSPTASTNDASRYASREAQNKQVENYKGGSVVVVGLSGGAVLVLLILLILLV